MNWKAILVGGLVGFGLGFFISSFVAPLGIASRIIAGGVVGLIGGIVAGMLSPTDAWKNGAGAGVVLTISNAIVGFFYIAFGFADLPSHDPIGAVGGFILALMWYAITGAIGGFVGGKIKREK